MKHCITLVFTIISAGLFGQDAQLKSLLDSGKAEYDRQMILPEADFRKAVSLFDSAVRLEPGNTTARYFYGYALDRLNSSSGAEMNRQGVALATLASEQFEYINRKEPHYLGEFISLDPYTKIESIWGGLAFSYLDKGDLDSARWALTEGKRRGGFLEAVLAFNTDMLNDCSHNSVLVTSGDIVTFSMLYLQLIGGIRTDVKVVDANLLHTTWYSKFLKREDKQLITLADETIDTLSYVPWSVQPVTVIDANGKGTFTWNVGPTYMGEYILQGDKVLLNILRNNIFHRDIFFSELVPDSSIALSLTEHIVPIGLVSQLVPSEISDAAIESILRPLEYSLQAHQAASVKNSSSAITLLNNYRWAYWAQIQRVLLTDEERAKRLFTTMKNKFPPDLLPYFSDQAKEYEDFLLTKIDERN